MADSYLPQRPPSIEYLPPNPPTISTSTGAHETHLGALRAHVKRTSGDLLLGRTLRGLILGRPFLADHRALRLRWRVTARRRE